MHLAIDEFYLRELIARPLLEGVKPPEGITFLPPPPDEETAAAEGTPGVTAQGSAPPGTGR